GHDTEQQVIAPEQHRRNEGSAYATDKQPNYGPHAVPHNRIRRHTEEHRRQRQQDTGAGQDNKHIGIRSGNVREHETQQRADNAEKEKAVRRADEGAARALSVLRPAGLLNRRQDTLTEKRPGPPATAPVDRSAHAAEAAAQPRAETA